MPEFHGLMRRPRDRRPDDAEPVTGAEFEPARDVGIRDARIGQASFGGRDPDLVVDAEQPARQVRARNRTGTVPVVRNACGPRA
jgi:hypothetical protein